MDGDQWSFDLTGLATGNNTVTVTVTHPDLGEVTRTLTINVNSQAPLITIDPAGTTPTVAGSQTLGGSWTGDSDPVVSVPTATVGAVTADAGAGTWSVDLTGLGAGKNAVAVSATANGVTATAHTLVNQQIFTLRTPYAGQYGVDPGTTVSVTFSEAHDLSPPCG